MERPRRTIEEIVQLHRREQSLQKEVFVEGLEDKYFYQSFLASHSLNHVAVFEISSVEISSGAVYDVGCNEGNKGRVIALASLLEGRVAVDQVVCVADADSDYLLGRTYSYSLLLLTDYTAIELYVFNTGAMSRVLAGISGFPKNAEAVLAELREPLEEAFFIRIAGEVLRLATQETSHSAFCSFDRRAGTLKFHSWEYACHLFKPNTDKSWRPKLVDSMIRVRTGSRDDPRFQIRGHDFRETFSWYVRQHNGFGGLNADTMSRMLPGFADPRDLGTESMFSELLRRLSS